MREYAAARVPPFQGWGDFWGGTRGGAALCHGLTCEAPSGQGMRRCRAATVTEESAAADEGDDFDHVALGEGAPVAVLVGDEFAVDFGGADGEAEAVDEFGEGGAFGEFVYFVVDRDEHGGL